MFEFMNLWVNSGQDLDMLRQRTQVFDDGANYHTIEQRQSIAAHWLHYAADIRRRQNSPQGTELTPAPHDLEFLDLIDAVAPRLPEILELFADVITPRKIGDLVKVIQNWEKPEPTSPAKSIK